MYEIAILKELYWFQIFIEFLVFEKGEETKITFESHKSELDVYMLDKHKDRMNKLLKEYEVKRRLKNESKT